MKIFRSARIAIILLGVVWTPATFAGDSPDLEVIHRIRQEAFKKSQVMDHLFYMTDVAGPRLTNSPGYQMAAEKIAQQAKAWGLENVALEGWEPFGRGWSNSYFSAHLTAPQYSPLIGMALSWTPGTDGEVSGTPVLAIFNGRDTDEERKLELERFKDAWRGKLQGRIVMIDEPVHLEPNTKPASKRFSGGELSERSEMKDPVEPIEIDFENPVVPENKYEKERFWTHAPPWLRTKLRKSRGELRDQLHQFLVEEGVRLLVRAPWRGDGGTIFPPQGGRHDAETPAPPSIVLATEHYNRIARLFKKGLKPQLKVETRSAFHEGTPKNVVAELPGGNKKDELVIIGAHLDDVVYATGATDNAAGCAIMMEAMRILKTLDLDMDRTVRMVLWSGEEQGLLGSRAYVKQHFGDYKTMELKSDHGKVSAYFNVDNGGGKLRGIHLQNNDMVGPIFSSWLSPFRSLGASTVTIRNTGGTDHQSFDAVGIPGFQFIQDPLEYSTRTHHSNMDVYDRVVASDLMQASAIVAALVYNTANREGLLPRKPLPEPWPESEQDDDD